MREFCPLCKKNGIKNKVKAFQLNLQEAVFMCSKDNCTWPVGYEDLTFIDRPVGKDWSNSWDELASKHLKKDSDELFEFSIYTPPQTPGDLTCKDAAMVHTPCPTTVPIKDNDLVPVFVEESISGLEGIFASMSESCVNTKNSDSINSVNIVNGLKPKLALSESVKYKMEKLPAKSYVFIKNNGKEKNTLAKVVRDKVCENIAETNKPTSLVKDPILNVNKTCNYSIPIPVEKVKEQSKNFFKPIRKMRFRNTPYKKFDFEELKREKSTNKKKEDDLLANTAKNSECVVNVKKEKLNESSKVLNSMNGCNSNITNSRLVKTENVKYESTEVLNNTKKSSSNNFNSNGLMKLHSNNVKNEMSTINFANPVKTEVDELPNFDSILALSNGSKDSGLDQDMTNVSDIELHLDELMAGFCDNLDGIKFKTKLNDSDDDKWIDSLFD